MDAKVKAGRLIIEIGMVHPHLSPSRKELIIATTKGAMQTNAVFRGKHVVVVMRAFVPPDPGQMPEEAEPVVYQKLFEFPARRGNGGSQRVARKSKKSGDWSAE